MSPALLGAAAALGTAGAGVFGSLINAQSAWKTNQQQYQYNKALAEQAYERNVKMWHMQNAYNTPSAQMARMRAAGLNPSAVFGEGVTASSGNTSGDAPQLNYGSYNPAVPQFDLSSPIQNAFSAYMLQAKRDNIEADTALKTGQTRKVIRETNNLELEAEKMKAQIEGLGLDNEAKAIANTFIEREKEAKISNLESGTHLNNEQARQVGYITDKILPKEVALKDAQLKDFNEKWNKWKEEVKLWASQQAKTDAEKELLVKDAENYALNHMQSGFLGTGASVINLSRARKDSSRKSSRLKSTVSGDRGAHPGTGRHGKSHRGNR